MHVLRQAGIQWVIPSGREGSGRWRRRSVSPGSLAPARTQNIKNCEVDDVKVEKSVLDAVFAQVEKDRKMIARTIAQLVQQPSVVGSEGPAQQIVQGLYEDLGLEMDIFTADEIDGLLSHPAYCSLQESSEDGRYSDRPNVVGVLPGDEDAPSLILNGHIDVVSAEPESRWTYPPWQATTVDGRMYGRGASDMKSGLVAAWAALRAIMRAGYRPRGTVRLQSVIEEEAGGGGGTLACFLRGHLADAFIAAEPSGTAVRIGSGGILYARVRVQGQTAHAGNAHQGVSAVYKMAPIVSALKQLDKERGQKEYLLFEQGSGGRSCHLNIGTYRAGDWPSTVAGWAEIEVRVGYLPGEKREEVMKQVEDTVMQAVRQDEWLQQHPPQVEWFGWDAQPWVEDEDDPFVQAVQQTASNLLDRPVPLYGRTSGVDSRFAHMFGATGICFGPRGANNHGIDEYVQMQSVYECVRVLAAVTLNWCGYDRQRR